MLIVFFAMMIDLASGLRKAKIRGELRSSQALKRSITKFITYEGSMIIALGVDMLIHMSKLAQMFGLDIPESDEYMTVGGLILSMAKGFPKVNEKVTVGDYCFRVLKKGETKIELVELTRKSS